MSLVWLVEGLNKTKRFNKRDSFSLTAKLGHDFFFPLWTLIETSAFPSSWVCWAWAGMAISVLPVLTPLCLDWNYTTDSAWALVFSLPTAGLGLVSLLNPRSQFLIINLTLFLSHSHIYHTHMHIIHTHSIYILYKLLIYIYVCMYVYVYRWDIGDS